MRYELMTAGRIVVGPGSSKDLPELLEGMGSRALLAHGKGASERSGPASDLIARLQGAGLVGASFAVQGEPDIPMVEVGARLAREAGYDMVIGIGGGSVLDAAKAIAGLAVNDGPALRYMEVVGEGRLLERPALPVAAIPTTSGAGAEVTRNAVVLEPERGVKASIRHPSLLPRLALVDSTLTHSLPPSLTASSGMDALTQLIEAYVSKKAQPMTDGFCREGLERVRWALPRAFENPEDAEAREAMSTASLLSGLALANAGLGAVHGIAAPLGGLYKAPHGAACAALLPYVTRANILALQQRDPDGPALRRYRSIAEILLRTGHPEREISPSSIVGDDEILDKLVAALCDLCARFHIQGLSAYGLNSDGIPALAAQSMKTSSTCGNPVELEVEELEQAIRKAMKN